MANNFGAFLALIMTIVMVPALLWLLIQSLRASHYNKPVREGMNRAYQGIQNLKLNGSTTGNTGRMHLANAQEHFDMARTAIQNSRYKEALTHVQLAELNIKEASRYYKITGNHPIPPSGRLITEGSGLVWLG
ncbi:MAG: hypothetical protein LCH63_20615 [Candidatus Melainabacteria bacterium]|nr:hypothetical protein [Candidatus Melainabacteria bacterium]